MEDGSEALVRRWISAYADGRDDDVVELAHPDVVLRPRRGQGARVYRGIEGVRRWLVDAEPRPTITRTTVEAQADGRVVAEALMDGMTVVAVFEIRDDRICGVSVYLSDRDLLEHLGRIGGGTASHASRRPRETGGPPPSGYVPA